MVRRAALMALAGTMVSAAAAQAQYHTTFYYPTTISFQPSTVYYSSPTVTYLAPTTSYFAMPSTAPLPVTTNYAPAPNANYFIPMTMYHAPATTVTYYLPTTSTSSVPFPVTYYETHPRWWWRWW